MARTISSASCVVSFVGRPITRGCGAGAGGGVGGGFDVRFCRRAAIWRVAGGFVTLHAAGRVVQTMVSGRTRTLHHGASGFNLPRARTTAAARVAERLATVELEEVRALVR